MIFSNALPKLLSTEVCETWILWKRKTENSFSPAHVCLPLLLRNEGLFPVLTWRQYSMERSWRYWNCLSQTFFHSAQGLSIPKWCFLGNIFPIDTWRTSKMRDHLEITIVWRSHLFQHEIVICKSAALFSDIHPSYIEVVICHSNLLEFVWNMAYTYMIVVKTLSKNKHR